MEFEDVTAMDYNEPVSAAISRLMRGEKSVIITKNGTYYGIFSELDVSDVIDTSKEKVGGVCRRAPLLSEKIDAREAVKEFLNGRFKALPIKTHAGFKILERNSFLKDLLKLNLLPAVKVGEIMTSPALMVEAGDSVGKAREIMRKNNIRRVVVVEDGKISGILAMKDILPLFESAKTRLPFVRDRVSADSQPVKDYMNREVQSVVPNATVADAVSLLIEHDIPSLVISEEDRPIGLLSIRDLFEYVGAQKERERIYFSGMDRGDEEYLDEVRSTISKALAKIENMMRVEYIAVHYKKQRYEGLRSRYEVKVRVKGDGIVAVTNADWNIRTATQGAMKELLAKVKRIVQKKKSIATGRQRDRRRK